MRTHQHADPWRRYGHQLVAVVATGFVLIVALTAAVDPYGLYGGVIARQAERMARTQNDRQVKPWDIIMRQPETVIFGTSRVEEGFDPTWFQNGYNAGIDATVMAETADMLEHAARFDRSLSTAYVELDFSSFVGGNPRNPRPPIVTLADLATDLAEFFFSTSAVEASAEMLIYPRKPRYYITPSGYSEAPGVPPSDSAKIAADYLAVYPSFAWYFTINYESAWSQLERARQTCARHRIRCVFFASPHSAPVLAAIDLHGDWHVYADFKRRLAAIGGVLDFDDPSGRLLEFGKPVYWHDSGHFTPAVGEGIARNVADGTSATLSLTNVDQRSDELRAAVKRWEARTGFLDDYRHAMSAPTASAR
jgi:hypothetical protein